MKSTALLFQLLIGSVVFSLAMSECREPYQRIHAPRLFGIYDFLSILFGWKKELCECSTGIGGKSWPETPVRKVCRQSNRIVRLQLLVQSGHINQETGRILSVGQSSDEISLPNFGHPDDCFILSEYLLAGTRNGRSVQVKVNFVYEGGIDDSQLARVNLEFPGTHEAPVELELAGKACNLASLVV